jgi:hypothetical protein
MGLTDSPTCERCLEKDESATHILCDCEAIAYLRFRHLGHYFMEPGGCTIDLGKVAVQGLIGAYPLFIHSFIHSLVSYMQLIISYIFLQV